MKKRFRTLTILFISSMILTNATNVYAHDCNVSIANCTHPAVCDICGRVYGEVDPNNHINTELRNAKSAACTEDGYTGDTYCKDCGKQLSTGSVIPATGHSGGTATCISKAVCEVCGEEYGELNADNHVGDTEIRDAKPATCTEDGYTGDTYCKSCDVQLSTGTVIPATGHKNNEHLCIHTYFDKLKYECSGGTVTCWARPVCEVCGVEYGDYKCIDTRIKNGYPATCTEDGFIGEIMCGRCTEMTWGPTIPATGHSGGTATCISKAVCEVCGEEYGELDAANHVGDTEIRDAKPATCEEDGYTGDTYCKSCDVQLSTGTVIPAGHKNNGHLCIHEYFDKLKYEYSGGTVTCWARPVCEVCRREYGDYKCIDTRIRNGYPATCTEDGFIGEIKCIQCGQMTWGPTIPATGHSGGTATCSKKAVCEVCGEEYGELDAANHVGTESRNVKEATCTEDGYTGDTYCTSCETKLLDGEPIAKLGHIDENKDHYCDREDCKAKLSECIGGVATCKDKAVCEVCGSAYGELNADNHVGDTEVRNAKEATCEEDGYTGDTYCTSCETKLLDGEPIAKLGHIDENKDHYCDREDCKAKLSECTGGVATCKDQSICDTCGNPYGDVDLTNHVGDTEVRNAKEATCTEEGYTGDTYCTSCETKLLDGTVIPALGHTGGAATCKDQAICGTCNEGYGETNSENHIDDSEIRDSKEATCLEDGYSGDVYCKGCESKLQEGIIIPSLGHKGGIATCKDQSICDTCGKPYGDVDLTNHVGDTEVRNTKEATCTEDGYTGDTYCVSCETELLDGTLIPALGHVDDNNDNICDRKYCKNIINPNLTSKPVVESPKPQTTDDGAVKTGDTTPLLQIFMLFSISGLVMCVSILSKVKTHRK